MLRLLKSSSIILNKNVALKQSAYNRHNLFTIQKANFSNKPSGQDSGSKYKEAFENLKSKINPQHEAKDDKVNEGDPISEMARNMYSNAKYGQDNIDPAKKAEYEAAKKAQEEEIAKREAQAKTQGQTGTQNANTTQQAVNNATQADATGAEAAQGQKPAEPAAPTKSFTEKLSEKSPFLGKVADFMVDSWEQTFPSDNYKAKAELVRRKAKEQAEKDRVAKVYTEEELAQIQEQIPEWKKTSLATYNEQEEDDKSIREKAAAALKEKFNQTDLARTLYQSDKYKEYEEFKKEMSQFKEDLNEHLSQSQNPAVRVSMMAYGKVTGETNTAMAIREMKKYMRNFDPFDLERDAPGIFSDVYNAFLRHDRDYIEKTCEEEARVYFKTLLKKREIDGVYPKVTQLWSFDRAQFEGGKISITNKPAFTYTIHIQQIHCNVSKKTEKIVDGAEDKVLQSRYRFVLSPHDTPDLETVGHQWVIVECRPEEAVALLA